MVVRCRFTYWRVLFLCFFAFALVPTACAQVVINEWVAGNSERLLRWDGEGKARLGTGLSWYEPEFDAGSWPAGPGPLGFGYGDLGTDVGQAMLPFTPSLYLRREFVVAPEVAANSSGVQLTINYDDGFVAYLNGEEIARRNLGPAHLFIYADQPSFNKRVAVTNETIRVSAGLAALRPGTNVLAIQVHNTWPIADLFPFDPSLRMEAKLESISAPEEPLVRAQDSWRYFVGLAEPSGGLAEPGVPGPEPTGTEFNDWLELHNQGNQAVSLAGWSLTDDAERIQKWVFPDVTLDAGGYLLVFCSGLDRRNPSQGMLQTNFKLSQDGEYLGLYDPSGAVADEYATVTPAQSHFHSYGRDPVSGRGVYFERPTPGAANGGTTFVAIVDPPRFSVPPGFYESDQMVSLSTLTLGAKIRFTLDGSEPTETSGFAYEDPLLVASNATLRACAFRAGWIASPVETATYLIRNPAAVQSLPVLAVTGDAARSLYKPTGIFAIKGGYYPNSDAWQLLTPQDYNMATMYGQAFEKPVSLEFLFADGRPPKQIDCGIRYAGSRWSRPRMTLLGLETTVWNNGWMNKPSCSFFFRNDYGGDHLSLPLFGDSSVTSFENLRVRAGKNDWSNPFVRDEVVRRLFLDMGQVGSHGLLCNMMINGAYKGYFNLVERIHEPFFQSWYHSTNRWDVRHVDETLEGDAQQWSDDTAFIRAHPLADPANYDEAARRFDVTNLVDYLVLNIYAAMWDWPENNFIMARERVPGGTWRFYVWDAEGSFGLYTSKGVDYDTVGRDLTRGFPLSTSPYETVPVLFSAFRQNPKFRLLFADRIQRHLQNGGVLTATNVLSRYADLKAELDPSLALVRGEAVHILYMTNWVNERPVHMLDQCRQAQLWPETLAPILSQAEDEIDPGLEVAISNPNGNGDVYYTVDGSDPRSEGGLPQGSLYSSSIPLSASTVVKARVWRDGEWSPLTEAHYVLPPPAGLRITEINYDPLPGGASAGSQFEFVELKNTSAQTLDLSGVGFTDGIEFDFTNGTHLAPGAFLVLVAEPVAFVSRYPGVAFAGVYQGKLNNDGERLTLSYREGQALFSVQYNDAWPWPPAPAKFGYTLVPDESGGPDPDDPSYWRSSFRPGGSPGADDPVRPVLPVILNEILTRSTLPDGWQVELFNPNPVPVDLAGWLLSDDPANPVEYRFPAGTTLPASGFLTLSQTALAGLAPEQRFEVYPQGGRLILFSGDDQTNLTGYVQWIDYDPAETDVSEGRYANSQGQVQFTSLTSVSLGLSNGPPKVGPVVISEIMYHPPRGGYKFVELANVSAAAVSLFATNDPTVTWRLDGVDFDFPPNLTLASGERLVVASVDPAVVRTKYDVPAKTPILGPWRGGLQDDGERLRLLRPERLNVPGSNEWVFITVDEVRYDNKAPWPVEAAGEGASLQRLEAAAYGNDPQNWFASKLTPGGENSPSGLPFPEVILVVPSDGGVELLGTQVRLSALATNVSAPVNRIEFFADEAKVGQAEVPPYEMDWTPGTARRYRLRAEAVLDGGSRLVSEEAEVTVLKTDVKTVTPLAGNASWKYSDTGADLGTNWWGLDFDDGGWPAGPAVLGYGINGLGTTVGYGPDPNNRYITTYFRRRFEAAAPEVWSNLVLRLMRDDGAVVYLNGEEILRSNMPEGPIGYRTQALSSTPDGLTFLPWTLEGSGLKAGPNELAVEVHQVNQSSGDLIFALELSGEEHQIEPWILQQPADVTAEGGEDVTLSAVLAGKPLSYQWYREGGSLLSGANQPVLALNGVGPEEGGGYYVVATNDLGAVTSRVAQVQVEALDSDGDGIPDYWEVRYGLDPHDPADGSLDPDGDGLTNAMEYMRRTDPWVRNPIISARLGSGAFPKLQLQFEIPPFNKAFLQYREDLNSGDWVVRQSFSDASTNQPVTVEIPVAAPGGFYRVSLEASP
jgi:CotH kinase protein/Chitobiase/beta-hexosaminidase C-terminal domain/Lamin Tail Domain/Fn3 associated/Bacterial Ig domain/Bacterial TSP3 repeat